MNNFPFSISCGTLVYHSTLVEKHRDGIFLSTCHSNIVQLNKSQLVCISGIILFFVFLKKINFFILGLKICILLLVCLRRIRRTKPFTQIGNNTKSSIATGGLLFSFPRSRKKILLAVLLGMIVSFGTASPTRPASSSPGRSQEDDAVTENLKYRASSDSVYS